ncbi:uncharacterized protein TNCV_455131 [Trichonephila clavipes]|nr:uncharacterized protein TNCV_455131 [Trichonephila clavipes]
MNVSKCIVPLRHGSFLNNRRTASPLLRLVEEEKRWEAPDHPYGVSLKIWNETEPKRTVTRMMLKATVKDRRTSSP